MNGLSMTAWRDPFHVRVLRAIKREPWGIAMTIGAWIVYGVCVVVSVFGIPLALLVMGGAS